METDEIAIEAIQALADPTRRAIVGWLRSGPRSVGEIAARLPVSQPAVSQHLATLRRAELVASRRDGRRMLYSLDRTGLIAIRAWVDGFWDDVVDAYARKARELAHRDGRTEVIGDGGSEDERVHD